MKYKTGDKVLVKSSTWLETVYCGPKSNDPAFVIGMSDYCGKVVTIEAVVKNLYGDFVYRILEDKYDYDWADYMFEDGDFQLEIF